MSFNSKNIYLARHAKSSWNSMALSDFDRPLSNRGFDDAQRMGEKISELGWNLDRVISSPALRARQTSKALFDQMKSSSHDIIWNKDIYAAYMVTLLHILSQQEEIIKSIMLVGHNPAMEDLFLHLCGDNIWGKYAQKNGKLFTTGNIAKISFNGSWSNLAMGNAELVQLLRPKELSS